MHPLISIVLPTKNALPHLRKAIDGIREQTYRNFELIIQDGGSTDGTLEYIETITDLPKVEVVSKPDSGIGQAYNRGIVRSKGEFLFLAAADECLFPSTLKKLISWFSEFPSAAVICGSVFLVNAKGKIHSRFVPPPFDLIKFIKCQITMSTAGLLNKKILGQELFYDESLKTCPDYEFYVRIGNLLPSDGIICRQDPLMTALRDRTSMSYRVEIYEQFCKDKIGSLDRFLLRGEETFHPCLKEQVKDRSKFQFEAKASILTWGAKMALDVEGIKSFTRKLCKEAETYSQQVDTPPKITVPASFSFDFIVVPVSIRTIFSYFQRTFDFFYFHLFRSASLPRCLSVLKKRLRSLLISAPKQPKFPQTFRGGRHKWATILVAALPKKFRDDRQLQYWVRIRMKLMLGVVDICIIENNEEKKEKIFHCSEQEIETYFYFENPLKGKSILFRNGGIAQSKFTLYELSILQSAPSTS